VEIVAAKRALRTFIESSRNEAVQTNSFQSVPVVVGAFGCPVPERRTFMIRVPTMAKCSPPGSSMDGRFLMRSLSSRSTSGYGHQIKREVSRQNSSFVCC
jgi:hypothetical protein